jgi:hypothetical protein
MRVFKEGVPDIPGEAEVLFPCGFLRSSRIRTHLARACSDVCQRFGEVSPAPDFERPRRPCAFNSSRARSALRVGRSRAVATAAVSVEASSLSSMCWSTCRGDGIESKAMRSSTAGASAPSARTSVLLRPLQQATSFRTTAASRRRGARWPLSRAVGIYRRCGGSRRPL